MKQNNKKCVLRLLNSGPPSSSGPVLWPECSFTLGHFPCGCPVECAVTADFFLKLLFHKKEDCCSPASAIRTTPKSPAQGSWCLAARCRCGRRCRACRGGRRRRRTSCGGSPRRPRRAGRRRASCSKSMPLLGADARRHGVGCVVGLICVPFN